jgi:adenine-specific DNA-methyltransferase
LALLEELIARVFDPDLRRDIEREVGDLKGRVSWGLVFERHLPESTRLLTAPIKPGSVVWERRSAKPQRFRVRSVEGSTFVMVPESRGSVAPEDTPTLTMARDDVLVEKDFADPVFPVLTSIGRVRNGPADRPSHVVIQSENYHALEVLLAAYEGQVDCLYLDPPYNTGDKDWAYNNDYVDPMDAWRSSKWLSFMERRLRLARRLLKADGVIVVLIDRNEVHHLGMLLEQIFPDALIQMVTIAINPSGTAGDGFSRVDEYAFFIFFGNARPNLTFEDFFGPEDKSQAAWWERLMRRGSSWVRSARPNLCYPIMVDADGHIAGAGEPFGGEDESARPTHQGEYELAWPIRTDGKLGIWRVDADRLRKLYPLGYAVTIKRSRGTWSARYLLDGAVQAVERGEIEVVGRGPYGDALLTAKGRDTVVPKTMWRRGRHAAGGDGGTQLVAALVGERGVFSYPKSVYSVMDTLDAAVGNRTNALIVDFFAGSGTTLHATLMLNARDAGQRRCVLVTNNELNYQVAARLNREGHFRGDPEFEAHGVFEAATRPRVTAAITGLRPDGQPVEGVDLYGREHAEGFPENVEFFQLDYLDPGAVELGMHLDQLHPLMWLAAGGIGDRIEIEKTARFAVPAGSPYAVLFDPSGMPGLLEVLASRHDVTHVFIVADSDRSFASLASSLPAHTVVQLYRRYLETLRGATS